MTAKDEARREFLDLLQVAAESLIELEENRFGVVFAKVRRILAPHHPRSVQTKVEPHPSLEGGWIATAEIVPDLSDKDRAFLEKLAETKDRDLFLQVFRELTKPTIATGSAHEGNLKGGQGPWSREMAETRALSRAISAFTGLALPVPEEDER